MCAIRFLQQTWTPQYQLKHKFHSCLLMLFGLLFITTVICDYCIHKGIMATVILINMYNVGKVIIRCLEETDLRQLCGSLLFIYGFRHKGPTLTGWNEQIWDSPPWKAGLANDECVWSSSSLSSSSSSCTCVKKSYAASLFTPCKMRHIS